MKQISSWTNLSDIIKANQGQGERMNDAVYGGQERVGDEALNRLGKAKSGFRLAADKAGNRDLWNADGSMRLDAPGSPVVHGQQQGAGANQAVWGGKGQSREEGEMNRLKMQNDTAQTAYRGAQQGVDAAQAGVAAATKAASDTYKGPRTLKEYDPNISTAIGDAAARLSASPTAQLAQSYKPTSAQGSALDMALMGQAGGNDRAAAIKGKFGGLLEQLNREQADASGYATGIADQRDAAAGTAAAQLPELQTGLQTAQAALGPAQIAAENNAARLAYEQQYQQENAQLRARSGRRGGRGSEIQRTYRPPESKGIPQ